MGTEPSCTGLVDCVFLPHSVFCSHGLCFTILEIFLWRFVVLCVHGTFLIVVFHREGLVCIEDSVHQYSPLLLLASYPLLLLLMPCSCRLLPAPLAQGINILTAL